MTHVLVAYATKHGSTAEIADTIGATLRETGIAVDVRPAKEVRALEDIDAVVLGSAVYMNKWQGDAIDFLKRFERELIALPTWMFSSGPTGGTAAADVKVNEVLASQPAAPGDAGKRGQRIGVRGQATFGGRIVPEMGGIFERWMPRGDWRDFDRVRTWARDIAGVLTP